MIKYSKGLALLVEVVVVNLQQPSSDLTSLFTKNGMIGAILLLGYIYFMIGKEKYFKFQTLIFISTDNLGEIIIGFTNTCNAI